MSPTGRPQGERGRFAPTPSGPAHPGTLLAALLCWLDARSRGAELLLRLEDVDPLRCSAESAAELRAALRWLGLDWDGESLQSARRADHERALDRLAEQGIVYACRCSRTGIRRAARPAADGGWVYPGTCRARIVAPGERPADAALRLALDPGRETPVDEGGLDLALDPARELGDPVLRRRDGALAYHLACVVDDAAQGITRVVRGRDLAVCTALHRVLQRRLGLPAPTYRHHFLLLEDRGGGKLAKLHGAVGWRTLRAHMSAAALCGLLAHLAGLRDATDDASPAELLADFDWRRVPERDRVLRWESGALRAD